LTAIAAGRIHAHAVVTIIFERGFTVNKFSKRTLACLILLTLGVVPVAHAQRPFARPMHRGAFVFVGGYFYDPFFGPYPWWSPSLYQYGYYPVYDDSAAVRIQAKPKEAAVYVDGFYAGIVDDFDGIFQRLTLSPGRHELTLYLDGYRTQHQEIYLEPRSTFKVSYRMERLAAGETSEKPALAPALPPPPPGSYVPPRSPARGPFAPLPAPAGPLPTPGPPPVAASGATANVGAIVIRVQPAGADVMVDGERWVSSDDERLVVQVSVGQHHIEVRKSGYRVLATDVDVRGGATVPLNISLSPE